MRALYIEKDKKAFKKLATFLAERATTEVEHDCLHGPGAGKTAATVQAVRDLMRHGGGVAYFSGDELRPFHPQYAALVAADRSTAANKTGADVGLWVERASREAAAGRFHAVIETTMRQPEVVRRTAKQVPPVKALENLRQQPLPDGERQRIAAQRATLAQRLDRDGVPAMGFARV